MNHRKTSVASLCCERIPFRLGVSDGRLGYAFSVFNSCLKIKQACYFTSFKRAQMPIQQL